MSNLRIAKINEGLITVPFAYLQNGNKLTLFPFESENKKLKRFTACAYTFKDALAQLRQFTYCKKIVKLVYKTKDPRTKKNQNIPVINFDSDSYLIEGYGIKCSIWKHSNSIKEINIR